MPCSTARNQRIVRGFLLPRMATVLLTYIAISAVFGCYPVFAHKVNIFAYAENGTVYTESYFPDGKPVADGKIEVYDSNGALVVEGYTDREGIFSFRLQKPVDLTIILDASMGHRAEYVLKSEEITGASGEGGVENLSKSGETQEAGPSSQESDKTPLPKAGSLNEQEIRRLVREELAEQLEPLRRSIMDLQKRETVSARDIFSGIGYILGLLGISMFVYSKKREKEQKKKE